ncbi:unnamed protein product [Timema podura]|uniref:Uncharacterized protein n=1 Tax=Timema podura TaxID=61482 RepID=A0ABN7NNU9_TIMPD|nr:unnamed protein product [Timema podura]
MHRLRDTHLEVFWIPSENNPADAVSRQEAREEVRRAAEQEKEATDIYAMAQGYKRRGNSGSGLQSEDGRPQQYKYLRLPSSDCSPEPEFPRLLYPCALVGLNGTKRQGKSGRTSRRAEASFSCSAALLTSSLASCLDTASAGLFSDGIQNTSRCVSLNRCMIFACRVCDVWIGALSKGPEEVMPNNYIASMTLYTGERLAPGARHIHALNYRQTTTLEESRSCDRKAHIANSGHEHRKDRDCTFLRFDLWRLTLCRVKDILVWLLFNSSDQTLKPNGDSVVAEKRACSLNFEEKFEPPSLHFTGRRKGGGATRSPQAPLVRACVSKPF